jgi:hypothetical protein
VHPFWSSHEEKRACVRLSMGGQPWPELELHGRPWGARRRGRGGEGEGERSRGCGWLCWRWGCHGGSCIWEGSRLFTPCWAALFVQTTACCAAHEGEEEEREKKKKRKEKKKEKEGKNVEFFLNLKIFGEKNKRQFMKLVKNL